MKYSRDQQNIVISQMYNEWCSDHEKRVSTIEGSYRKTNIYPMLRIFTDDGEVTPELIADGELLERYQDHALQSAVFQNDLCRLVKLQKLINAETTEIGYKSKSHKLTAKVCDMEKCNSLIDAAKAVASASGEPVIYPKVEDLFATSISAGTFVDEVEVNESFLDTLYDSGQSSFLHFSHAPSEITFTPSDVAALMMNFDPVSPASSLPSTPYSNSNSHSATANANVVDNSSYSSGQIRSSSNSENPSPPNRKKIKALRNQAGAILTAKSFHCNEEQIFQNVAEALHVSHVQTVQELQACFAEKEALKGITVTAGTFDLSAPMPSTYAGAHVNPSFLEQIKSHQDAVAAKAAAAAANAAAKEKDNRDKLRGNEVLQASIIDIYDVHIDARGDYMFGEGEEDDTFKDYLNQFTLPELKNYYKAVTISTAFAFGRSVPATTTTKGAVISLILAEVKTRHAASLLVV